MSPHTHLSRVCNSAQTPGPTAANAASFHTPHTHATCLLTWTSSARATARTAHTLRRTHHRGPHHYLRWSSVPNQTKFGRPRRLTFLRVFLSDKATRHHSLKTLCKTFVERRYACKTFSASTTAQISLCLAVGVTVGVSARAREFPQASAQIAGKNPNTSWKREGWAGAQNLGYDTPRNPAPLEPVHSLIAGLQLGPDPGPYCGQRRVFHTPHHARNRARYTWTQTARATARTAHTARRTHHRSTRDKRFQVEQRPDPN